MAKHIPNKFHKSNPYTIQNIKLWCKLNDKTFELIDRQEYKGAKELLQWKCLKEDCQETFKANWEHIKTGNGCSYCAGKQIGLSNCLATKKPKLASEWHPILNGNLTPWDVTCGSGKKVWWQCDKGHEWKISINSRTNKENECPFCAGFYPSENYNLLIYYPKIASEWNYNKNDKRPEEYTPSSNKRVWWECLECGYEWYAIINNRVAGRGCPKCAESKGEKQLEIILTNYNIPHDSQYTFDDLIGVGGGLLKFDKSVFWDKEQTQLRMLIEYDGIFHYEKQYDDDGFETIQIHDELKNQYCKNNNIKLLRIPYWEFDNIEDILMKDLSV